MRNTDAQVYRNSVQSIFHWSNMKAINEIGTCFAIAMPSFAWQFWMEMSNHLNLLLTLLWINAWSHCHSCMEQLLWSKFTTFNSRYSIPQMNRLNCTNATFVNSLHGASATRIIPLLMNTRTNDTFHIKFNKITWNVNVSFQFHLLRIYYAFCARAFVYQQKPDSFKIAAIECACGVASDSEAARFFFFIVSEKKIANILSWKIIRANLMLNCFSLRECIIEAVRGSIEGNCVHFLFARK